MNSGDKIVIISEDLAEPWDEGFKNFAHSLAVALHRQHNVLMINVDRSGKSPDAGGRVPGTRTFFSTALRQKIRSFSPHKIIYIPSASTTSASFVRAAALRCHAPRAAVAMAGLQPRRRNWFSWLLIKWLAPHVVLTLSYRTLLSFERRSIRAALLPLGIDPSVFRPAAPGEKRELRGRYGLPDDAFVFLHAGHLSPSRNLLPLTRLADMRDSLVLLVSSTSTPDNARLRRQLEGKGVRVIREVVAIEEFYRLSDCYVFPVEDPYSCAEVPLGVLEALASGIPVLSRPFGGLRDLFPQGKDIIYWNSPAELVHAAEILRGGGSLQVRDMSAYSWDAVADKTIEILQGIH
ncbi:MAG: glycosyltransferase family 4 protein [Candidatus Latescibacterota bacterium]